MATTYAAQQPLQLQQQQQPPPPVDYGQDDIAAVILDPGYSVTRAGLGGDDAPRSVIPTAYGRYSAGGGGDGGGDGDGDGDGETRFVYGDELYVKPRPGLSIHNPMNRDGTVEDWDMARRVWEHAFTSRLTGTSAPRHLFNDAATSLATTTAKTTPAAATAAATPTLDDRPLSETPLLMTECGWNSAKAREKMIETAMDEWGAPAFYLARSGSLAAFAAGRASALVVDVGAANVAVTPVHDGTAIKRAITHGPLAGEFVSAQIRAVFRLNAPRAISLAPHYLVAAKQGQSGRASPEYRAFTSPSRAPHASYRRFMEERTVLQFKESVVQAWPGPTGLLTLGPNGVPMEELARSSAPARPFEFPDGHSQAFGTERFRVVEPLFDSRAALPLVGTEGDLDGGGGVVAGQRQPGAAGAGDGDGGTAAAAASSAVPAQSQLQLQTIPELVRAALEAVDAELAPLLLQNVVLVGATTLTPGFADRLNAELAAMYPRARVRVVAATSPAERKYAAWIGGSIVASLGTFNQAWISRKEYEEHGPGIVEKRCK